MERERWRKRESEINNAVVVDGDKAWRHKLFPGVSLRHAFGCFCICACGFIYIYIFELRACLSVIYVYTCCSLLSPVSAVLLRDCLWLSFPVALSARDCVFGLI